MGFGLALHVHLHLVLALVLFVIVAVVGKEPDPDSDSQSRYHRFQITEARLLRLPDENTLTETDTDTPVGLLIKLDDGFGPTCIFADAESHSSAFPECLTPDACSCQSISGLAIKSWSPLIVIGSIKTCCEGKGPRKKKRFMNIGDKKRVLAKVLDMDSKGKGKGSSSDLTATWQLINPQTVLVTIRNPAEPPRGADDSGKGVEEEPEPWSVKVCLISGDGLEEPEFVALIRKGKYKECYKGLNFMVKGGKPSLWSQDDVQTKLKKNLGVSVVWRSPRAAASAKGKATASPKTEL